jgi:hypothetical protein
MMGNHLSIAFSFALPVCALVAVGCSEADRTEPITAPSASAALVTTRTGATLPETSVRDVLIRTTRILSLALSDPNVRARVYSALQESPYKEHKLHFHTMLETDSLGLLRAMETQGRVSANAIMAALDSVMDLEFYMPVKSHWAAWSGGPEVLVATAIHDEDIPVAYNLAGAPVPISSAHVPPKTPTLALVPVETNFARSPDRSTRVTQAAATSPTGLYMTFSYIQNGHSDYEGFLMGDPEFEVLTMATRPTLTGAVDWQCAGEHANEAGSGHLWQEMLPEYVYDQNDDSWTGSVLLLSRTKLDSLQSEGRDAAFMVWEDDNQACQLYTNSATWHDIKQGLELVGASTLLVVASADAGPAGIVFSVVMSGLAFWEWLHDLYSDDFVGTLLPTCRLGIYYPDANYVIVNQNGTAVGRANVVNTDDTNPPPACAPPPLSVSLDVPSSAPEYTSVTATAMVSHYSGALTYSWNINGSPACGNNVSCAANVGSAGSYTSFAVTVSDAQPQTDNKSATVFAEYPNCPGCVRPGKSDAAARRLKGTMRLEGGERRPAQPTRRLTVSLGPLRAIWLPGVKNDQIRPEAKALPAKDRVRRNGG